MAERWQKFLTVAGARLLLLDLSVVQTNRGKTAFESSTASALVAVVSVQASAWRCWALPAAVAAAITVMVASPHLSANMSMMRLGCFSTVASVACSACGARLAWVLSVAVVLVVMAAWTQSLS